MTDSIIVTQDCDVKVPLQPERHFTAGELVQPGSIYYWALIESGYGTDSGIPATDPSDPTASPVYEFTTTPNNGDILVFDASIGFYTPRDQSTVFEPAGSVAALQARVEVLEAYNKILLMEAGSTPADVPPGTPYGTIIRFKA